MKKTFIALISALAIANSLCGTVFAEENTVPENGWYENSGGKYYYENSQPAHGWRRIDGEWYCFDYDDGTAATGKTEMGSGYYFFDEHGKWTGRLAKAALAPKDFEFEFQEIYLGDEEVRYHYSIENGRLCLKCENRRFSRKLSEREYQIIYSMLEMYCFEDCSVYYSYDPDDEVGAYYLGSIDYTANGKNIDFGGDDILFSNEYEECQRFQQFYNCFSEIDNLKEYADEKMGC